MFSSIALTLSLVGCGGSGSVEPEPYVSKTITGTVVIDGQASINTWVHISCSDGNGGVRNYYAKTNAQGVYRKSIEAAYAPCVADAPATDTYLFGFAGKLDTPEITANISALTDTLLIYILGNRSFADTLPTETGLAELKVQLSQGKDSAAWAQLRKMLLTGVYFTDPADVAAMVLDPATDAIRISEGVPPPGHYALLQKLHQSGYISRSKLQTLLYGTPFEVLPESDGSELVDLSTGLVWQRCVQGMTWDGTTCSGTPGLYFWTELTGLVASATPSKASKASPWRLPKISELHSLRSLDTQGVDPSWLPGSPGYWTWTGESPCVIGSYSFPAWVVHMQNFYNACGEASDQLHVRLVR